MATKKSTPTKKTKAEPKVKVYKRLGSIVKSENFIPFGNADALIDKIKSRKQDALIREGDFSKVVIWDKVAFNFTKTDKGSSFRKSVYLFGVVRKEAKLWLKNNANFELPTQYPVNVYNEHYKHLKKEMAATDLDHAYWRIAYVKGYISKNTYEHGIKDEKSKTIRLATLGVLGTEQKFDKYVNGEYVETTINRKENKAIKMVYKDIRLTCFYMMYELSIQLGEDFESWNTDCIYYRDSVENRKIVHEFFDMHNMLYKQLTYNTMDYFEGVDELDDTEPTQEPTE